MDDLARFCCLTPSCPDYGRRDAGNLVVHGRYGVSKRYRLLRCRTCDTRFSERKGTIFYGSRLTEEKAVSLLEHLNEGCGVRQTGRLVKVNRNTVMRYNGLAGQHAHDAHDELVAFSPSNPRGPVR